MKLFLVIDEWLYDGGFTLFGIYTNVNQALIRQQKERRAHSEVFRDYKKKFGKEFSTESYRNHRLEAITIKEEILK